MWSVAMGMVVLWLIVGGVVILNGVAWSYSTQKLNDYEFGNDTTEKALVASAVVVDVLYVAAYLWVG